MTAAKRRELEVAAAVAREAVMQLHVTRSTKLIEMAGDRVSAVRMLTIYTRLHNLSTEDTQILTNRVLAQLGQRSRKSASSSPAVFIEGEEEAIADAGSLFRVVRDRLRGRIHHDLRRWVELHTGSAQVALLDIHVKHSQRFVRELAKSHTVGEALDVYREFVNLDGIIGDSLYMFVLDKLAEEELPRPTRGSGPKQQDQVTLFTKESARPKKVI